MAEHFGRKAAYGFSSALESVRSLVTPTTFRSAVAALMVSGCASNGIQQSVKEPSVEEPKSMPSAVSESEAVNFMCWPTGEFNVSPKRDQLSMEVWCIGEPPGGLTVLQSKDEIVRQVSGYPEFFQAPLENANIGVVSDEDDKPTVTVYFKKPSDGVNEASHVELQALAGQKYEYSFYDSIKKKEIEPRMLLRTLECRRIGEIEKCK